MQDESYVRGNASAGAGATLKADRVRAQQLALQAIGIGGAARKTYQTTKAITAR
jgi:hypothetical protein